MDNYKIDYEILNYNKYNNRLSRIVNNPNNKYKVIKHEPIGYSLCGFPIDHFSIGEGSMHITYMGGAHGNEIISVDYVTQLMNNLALGVGDFSSFDPSLFTIDFIPCQNPEAFYTTTYALDSLMKDMNDSEIEQFCKKYWKAFRQDDINFLGVNYIIKSFLNEYDLSDREEELINYFWIKYNKSDIDCVLISNYLISFFEQYRDIIPEFVNNKWQKKFGDMSIIDKERNHQRIFNEVSIDCIPDIDISHRRLKSKLEKIYSMKYFPISTLANFCANASGVNLNDNNEYYFEEFKKLMDTKGVIYAKSRYNNIIKSIPGPIGLPSKDMDGSFEYEPENIALLKYLENLEEKNQNYAFFNCHGTGGLLYVYPVWQNDMKEAHEVGVDRDFSFYINGSLAGSYESATGNYYEKVTGINDPYKTMSYPNKITGVGDYLRQKYIASFVLELSKMGGNPIAPYGDRYGNYKLTMISNMKALNSIMHTIKRLSHLYDSGYHMEYDSDGRVHYYEIPRKR